jgi:hypothetical protein
MPFKIHSELSEKQIEADIATYFGWITPTGNATPFRLLDIDEQITGADKLFDSVIPIYMQFKVSEGLTRLTNNLFVSLFPLTPLQRIRVFRSREHLYDDPTLYFKLRAKAETATDFQHNILMKFANTGSSYSFYVAPLTLTRIHYEQMLYSSVNRFLPFPFDRNEIIKIYQTAWVSHLGLVPFLRGHVSIVPHETVSTENHFYSFSPNGTDIAWHSSWIVSQSATRLSDQFKNIFSTAFNNRERWTSLRSHLQILSKYKDFDFFQFDNAANNDLQPIQQLVNFGKKLYDKYQIRQLLLLSRNEFLSEIIK